MTENTDTLPIKRWDAWLCEPGADPFLLGVVHAPTNEEAGSIARETLPSFAPEKDPAHVTVLPEDAPKPLPAPALPPTPMRRVELERVTSQQVRAVLLRFLPMVLELEDRGPVAVTIRVRQLRTDLRAGELGALELCEDVAREATDLLSTAASVRAQALEDGKGDR